MPVKKEDAHRALELLEQYHSRLTKPQDRQLRNAIERVIRVFKGRLFQALLDIQEYYELTLLNDTKSVEEKTQETNQVVSRWERNPPILINTTSNNNSSHRNFNYSIDSEEPLPQAPPSEDAIYGKPNKSSSAGKAAQHKTSAISTSASVNNGIEQWEYDDIVLERGPSGLGFSIAGGSDNPHIGDDPSIYITKLIDGGTAVMDGRLKVNDILMSVNEVPTVNVTHAQCVDALKRAGKHVKLVVKRLSSEQIVAVELVKAGRGLGFSIAGGVGNQHTPGDNGIFITKLTEGGTAEDSGKLGVGDRLISVNDSKLTNVTHEEAVAILKSTNDRVKLVVGKPKGGVQSDGIVTPHVMSPNVTVSTATAEKQKHQQQQVEKPSKTAKKAKPHKSSTNEDAVDANTGIPRGPRKITLRKGSSGLGFNIVGGEEAEGIFVSFILQGGPADISGKLHKGDQILSVNDIDMRNATHEQAAAALKGAGDQVDIVAQYRINEYNQFEAKIHDLREQMMNASSSSLKSTNQNKSLFVRALFNYNADDDADNPGKGVSFKFGDVFHVMSAVDSDWWQVQKVIPEDEIPGIIPSQHRVEKMERAKLKSLKAEKNKKKKKSRRDTSNDQLNESGVDENINVLSYEPMIQKEVAYARPVIILGPLKDQLNDDLLSEYPEFFENCIPHTTRPKKEDEVDGRDYYFVASREQMERDIENHLFIEAGQYKDNLYGTSVQSVRDVASKDKHCVLDVSGHAIKRLRSANLHPIAILIKPLSPANVRQWNAKVTEEQANKTYEKALKFEQEFGLDFTAVVSGEKFDDIYEEVKNIIQNHSGSIILVPSPRDDEQ